VSIPTAARRHLRLFPVHPTVFIVGASLPTLALAYSVAPIDMRAPIAAVIAAAIAGLAAVKLHRLRQALAAEVEKRCALEHDLEQLAVTDAATGVMNRRAFMNTLNDELNRCDRNGAPLSLLILDLDAFKSINDRFGHATGDRVLADFARLCRDTVRTMDLIGRLGGEEFAILLPETDGSGAAQLAERLRSNVEQMSIQPAPDQQLSITASIGIAERRHREPLDALMYRADTAMHEAKNLGRNRVSGDLPPPVALVANSTVH
jgi:diguanylate cyclase (GGDEF)-like protein